MNETIAMDLIRSAFMTTIKVSLPILLIAMVIGLIISVLQDSAETALNSSTDVLFTAAADPKYAR